MNTAIDRVQSLQSPSTGGGVHPFLFHAACCCAEAKFSDAEIANFLSEKTSDCGRPVPNREINAAIRDARRKVGYMGGDDATDNRPPIPHAQPKRKYQPDKLIKVASRIDEEITAEYLEARSRFTCWNRSPAGVLHKLYKPGEKVVVFNDYYSQGCEVWEHPGIAGDLSTLDYLKSGQQGVWFLANPVDGTTHWNPREEDWSRRSEESVTDWRYGVIESDKAPKNLWLKALVQWPLPIASICDSGGDSIHAVILVNASSKREWDRIVRDELAPIIVPMGADMSSLTAVRLTRLPNCRREEKGQVQSLLYLNPDPNYLPIASRLCRKEATYAA